MHVHCAFKFVWLADVVGAYWLPYGNERPVLAPPPRISCNPWMTMCAWNGATDLGHFNRPAIHMSFFSVVYPALILTYLGQAAYLLHHVEDVRPP